MGRGEVDEKQLLSDLSKFFSAAKTAMKAAKLVKQQQNSAASDDKKKKTAVKSSKKKKLSQKDLAAKKKEKSIKRKSCNGGTIRVTLKGGYTVLNRGVPGTVDEKGELKRCAFRAQKSSENAGHYKVNLARDEKEFTAAVKTAKKEYDDSVDEQQKEHRAAVRQAIKEAKEAGEEVPADEEGDLEFEEFDESTVEKYQRTERPPVGTYFAKLVTNSGGEIVPIAPQDGGEASHFFAARENPGTKCLVKIKGPKNMKATGTLTTVKQVNYFKTNFGQLVKKELQSAVSSSSDNNKSGGKNKKK